MSIEKITPEQLRIMSEKEGLILQGCGGDPQEWLDGINGLLADEGILKDGSKFDNCFVFEHESHTNILFPFEGADLDMGKLAMWRLQTHEQFGGTWLSDYVPNRLGGFVNEEMGQERVKPDCPLLGADSNIFSLMGIASRTLKRCGMADEAKEMCDRITESGSYHEALGIIGEYVNIVSQDECFDEDEDESENINMEGGMS